MRVAKQMRKDRKHAAEDDRGQRVEKRGRVFPAAPIIFSQTLYGLADLLIIGQFEGAAGTTAVSVI